MAATTSLFANSMLWVVLQTCSGWYYRHHARLAGSDGKREYVLFESRTVQYSIDTVSKPLVYLLLWRLRLFSIAPLTMVNRPATWDLDKTTVYYKGISVSMDQIRHLCQHTTDRARQLLYDSLMFEIDHIPRVTSQYLEESDSERVMGWWFGKHAGNSALLNGVMILQVGSRVGSRRRGVSKQSSVRQV